MSTAKHGKCEDCGKNYEDILITCGHCGYSPHGTPMKNEADPFWKCGNCSRTVQAKTPPEKCPGCGEVCDFKNITCYTPECGGPGNIIPIYRFYRQGSFPAGEKMHSEPNFSS